MEKGESSNAQEPGAEELFGAPEEEPSTAQQQPQRPGRPVRSAAQRARVATRRDEAFDYDYGNGSEASEEDEDAVPLSRSRFGAGGGRGRKGGGAGKAQRSARGQPSASASGSSSSASASASASLAWNPSATGGKVEDSLREAWKKTADALKEKAPDTQHITWDRFSSRWACRYKMGGKMVIQKFSIFRYGTVEAAWDAARSFLSDLKGEGGAGDGQKRTTATIIQDALKNVRQTQTTSPGTSPAPSQLKRRPPPVNTRIPKKAAAHRDSESFLEEEPDLDDLPLSPRPSSGLVSPLTPAPPGATAASSPSPVSQRSQPGGTKRGQKRITRSPPVSPSASSQQNSNSGAGRGGRKGGRGGRSSEKMKGGKRNGDYRQSSPPGERVENGNPEGPHTDDEALSVRKRKGNRVTGSLGLQTDKELIHLLAETRRGKAARGGSPPSPEGGGGGGREIPGSDSRSSRKRGAPPLPPPPPPAAAASRRERESRVLRAPPCPPPQPHHPVSQPFVSPSRWFSRRDSAFGLSPLPAVDGTAIPHALVPLSVTHATPYSSSSSSPFSRAAPHGGPRHPILRWASDARERDAPFQQHSANEADGDWGEGDDRGPRVEFGKRVKIELREDEEAMSHTRLHQLPNLLYAPHNANRGGGAGSSSASGASAPSVASPRGSHSVSPHRKESTRASSSDLRLPRSPPEKTMMEDGEEEDTQGAAGVMLGRLEGYEENQQKPDTAAQLSLYHDRGLSPECIRVLGVSGASSSCNTAGDAGSGTGPLITTESTGLVEGDGKERGGAAAVPSQVIESSPFSRALARANLGHSDADMGEGEDVRANGPSSSAPGSAEEVGGSAEIGGGRSGGRGGVRVGEQRGRGGGVRSGSCFFLESPLPDDQDDLAEREGGACGEPARDRGNGRLMSPPPSSSASCLGNTSVEFGGRRGLDSDESSEVPLPPPWAPLAWGTLRSRSPSPSRAPGSGTDFAFNGGGFMGPFPASMPYSSSYPPQSSGNRSSFLFDYRNSGGVHGGMGGLGGDGERESIGGASSFGGRSPARPGDPSRGILVPPPHAPPGPPGGSPDLLSPSMSLSHRFRGGMGGLRGDMSRLSESDGHALTPGGPTQRIISPHQFP
uniref:Uncharacterized protein n=1 Tax=Chromera velia CCMP2878 TaxID=1169474 RepID=A0A0G4I6N7_9ALVE|eukprot:Cvel_1900.t1-p1 / transcript=Cvel_1900.t1 / gene=Cvel_1900 / organism=Chromera_velia_CCMP2878 / gene_product=hypothetical protein / transcript_product=hypothetical protein / location=Cvel_scaffold71:50942-54703(+) / protein_length=1116 / sequence_SO=supercontig / SO=protein_coding / is_pseudo=false